MSQKAGFARKKNKPLPSQNEASPVGTNPSTREQVKLRAYEMYESRSHEHGFAEQDWLKAEAEVLAQRR